VDPINYDAHTYILGTIAAHEAIIHIKANKKGHYTKKYQKDRVMGAINERENNTKKEKMKSPKKRGNESKVGKTSNSGDHKCDLINDGNIILDKRNG